MPTVRATPEEIEKLTKMALDRGGTVTFAAPMTTLDQICGVRRVARKPTPQVSATIFFTSDGGVRLTLPILTKSEANQGGNWKGKSKRTKDARRQVSLLCGPKLRKLARFAEHYHAGGILRAKFTRLGGRKLDRMANLGAALKATEDAICLMLGVDDGDPRWVAVSEQEPDGAVGVRIEITLGSKG